jgi:hypothetical protein
MKYGDAFILSIQEVWTESFQVVGSQNHIISFERKYVEIMGEILALNTIRTVGQYGV